MKSQKEAIDPVNLFFQARHAFRIPQRLTLSGMTRDGVTSPEIVTFILLPGLPVGSGKAASGLRESGCPPLATSFSGGWCSYDSQKSFKRDPKIGTLFYQKNVIWPGLGQA